MASLIVSYPRHDGASFDADYYQKNHVPLVRKAWTQHGMTDVEAFFAADDGQPYAAVVVVKFRDADAVDAALGSSGTADLQADIEPVLYRAG